MASYDLHKKAAALVHDAGGRLVGRTRLQKVAYLSKLAGFANDFAFEYRHFGPFSQDLAEATEIATGLGFVTEAEKQTEWGGWYSVYETNEERFGDGSKDENRARFIETASKISAVALELAATAAFLYDEEGIGKDNDGDPWEETRSLKPEKSTEGRLEQAKDAYRKLQELGTPVSLPPIA